MMASVTQQSSPPKVLITYSPDGKTVTISNDQSGMREVFQKQPDTTQAAATSKRSSAAEEKITCCCADSLFIPMCGEHGECSAFNCGANMFILATLPVRGFLWVGQALLTCVCAPCIGCVALKALT